MAADKIQPDYMEQARADYDRALKLNPKLTKVEINYGLLEIYTDRYDDAVTRYRKLLEQNKNDYELLTRTAEAHRKKGEKLLKELTTPKLTEPRLTEPRLTKVVKFYKDAIRHYLKAIKENALSDAICKDVVYAGLAFAYSELATASLLLKNLLSENSQQYSGVLNDFRICVDSLDNLIHEKSFPAEQLDDFQWQLNQFKILKKDLFSEDS